MENIIRIGYKPSQLTGIGSEYLVVDGFIIAKFWNGNIVTESTQGNEDETQTAAR